MILALILIGVFIVAAVLAFLATKAPIGYQDDRGFHFSLQRQMAPLPKREKILHLRFPISWAKPAWALVALIVLLLTIGLQPDGNQKPVHASSQHSSLSEKTQRENVMLVGPSAQLFPNFCQRNTEIQ